MSFQRSASLIALATLPVVSCNAWSQAPFPLTPPEAPAGQNDTTAEKSNAVAAKAGQQAAAVRLVGTEGTPWKFETGKPSFSVPFRIEPVGPEGAQAVAVSVRKVWGPDGSEYDVKCQVAGKPCNGTQFNLEPGMPVDGTLSGTIGPVGVYRSWITLTHAGRLESRLIELTRVLRDPNFSISTDSGENPLWIMVRETAGEATRLGAPAVTLVRNQKNRSATQARFDAVAIFDERGKRLSDGIDLAANQPRRLRVCFVNLEPGEYAGRIEFTAINGSKPAVAEIKQLSERWSVVWALLTLVAGIALSHQLREWSATYRPLLVKRQSLSGLRADLADNLAPLDALTPAEARVRAAVDADFDRIDRELDDDGGSSFDARYATLQAKVGVVALWVIAGRRIAVLKPVTLRAQFRARLEGGERFLVDPRAATTDPSIETLRGLDAAITQAVRAEYERLTKELRTEVQGHVKNAAQPLRQRLLQKVLPSVEKVDVGMGNNVDDLPQLLEDARTEYAQALIDDLRDSVSGSAPAYVEQPTWDVLRKKVLATLDGLAQGAASDVLTQGYQAALRDYVVGVAEALRREVEQQASVVGSSNIDTGLKDSLKKRLQAIGATLVDIAKQANDPATVSQAATAITPLVEELKQIETDYTKAAKAPLSSQRVTPQPGAINAGGQTFDSIADPGKRDIPKQKAEPQALAKQRKFREWIRTGDAIVTIAAGLIGLVLGIKAVWIDDPGWGGFEDVLLAFLWGLGLHQGASGVFEGIVGVKRKFSTTATATAASPPGALAAAAGSTPATAAPATAMPVAATVPAPAPTHATAPAPTGAVVPKSTSAPSFGTPGAAELEPPEPPPKH